MSALYNEDYRPQFHFTARSGWLNDPVGLIFFNGEYHLFFQHNPHGVEWGNMTWGHAVSGDLMHWHQLGHAILPDALGTAFSGSAVIDHDNTAGFGAGAMVCLYTAAGGTSDESKGQPFTQCLAYSADGRGFTKFAGNPIMKKIAGENRDPKVFWHAGSGRWIMVLFLEKNDFAFYASPDLKAWTHLQTMAIAGCDECPDFFPLAVDGDAARVKWVFTVANGRYLTGDFDGARFVPDNPDARPIAGDHFYAVQTFSDMPDGRRVQIAWLRLLKYPGMPFSQQMGVPMELTLRTGGTIEGSTAPVLCAEPIAELEGLRTWSRLWEHAGLLRDEPFVCADLGAGAGEGGAAGYDVFAAVAVGDAERIEFTLCGFTLTWDRATQMLEGRMPLPMREDAIRFRALVDRASIEVFAHGGEALMVGGGVMDRAAPQISIVAHGGSASVERLEVFGLRGIWRDA